MTLLGARTQTQTVYVIRHGETEWSRTGRHTSRTDVPLTPEGRRAAEAVGRRLNGRPQVVFTSPLARARETCQLAGYGTSALVEPDLHEWDYGVYEGHTTQDIRNEEPGWTVWNSRLVDGESIEDVARRARHVIARVLDAAPDDVALFAHGHILRVLAACWIAHPPHTGQALALDTATISVLGYEHETRVIRQWNLPVSPANDA
jgi:broad specificity phosphatase PhoE